MRPPCSPNLSNVYLQHLELFCVNMQTFNSNVDSLLVSATTGEPQKSVSPWFWRYWRLNKHLLQQHDIITEDSGIETVTPHVDSLSVSYTIDELQKSVSAWFWRNLRLNIVTNISFNRQMRLEARPRALKPSGTVLAIVNGNLSKRRPLSFSPTRRAQLFHRLFGACGLNFFCEYSFTVCQKTGICRRIHQQRLLSY